MVPNWRRIGCAIAALLVVALSSSAARADDDGDDPPPAAVDGYLIPHVLETVGRIASTPNSIDTNVLITDLSAARGTPLTYAVELQLLDKAGAPLRSASGAEVCNPCVFDFGPGNPAQHNIVVDQLIAEAGGPRGAVTLGMAVVRPIGATADDFDVAATLLNAKTGALDLDVSWVPVRRLASSGGGDGDGDRPCRHRHGRRH